ncbi:RNA polymerase sigma factor [Reyranella sp. CPCC 100927]|uniref:RNA polymerase sigma factor n=1 Tax=Reyranella sp. CPCC 100927 TaxID=2599616 RepID=UPI0021028533|nr:sigma-70 family RNA polymerase sigma factor [Reyranella sp. CPCC 100927]
MMERSTVRIRWDVGAPDAPARDIARALRSLSNAELARLKALARLWSRGLPGGLGWVDILNEAIVRALNGVRPWPPDVPLLAFLSGVMRSICDEHWRRVRRELAWVVHDGDVSDVGDDAATAPPDAERVLAAAQALTAIHRLFSADQVALKIIAGLAEGLTASEICRAYGLSEREYDSARKRMRRALLRAGLSWSVP